MLKKLSLYISLFTFLPLVADYATQATALQLKSANEAERLLAKLEQRRDAAQDMNTIYTEMSYNGLIVPPRNKRIHAQPLKIKSKEAGAQTDQ